MMKRDDRINEFEWIEYLDTYIFEITTYNIHKYLHSTYKSNCKKERNLNKTIHYASNENK